MISSLGQLRRIGFLTPKGLFHFANSVRIEGINLMALARYGAKLHPDRTAIHGSDRSASFAELHRLASGLAFRLHEFHGLRAGNRVALLGRNHLATVAALLALSRLGADIHVVNVDMAPAQLRALLDSKDYTRVLADEEHAETVLGSTLSDRFLRLPDLLADASENVTSPVPRPARPGRIVVPTGGTSGKPKTADRKPSIQGVARPFLGLFEALGLDRCASVFLATPVYHGYGLSFFIISLFLGLEIHLVPRYRTETALGIIRDRRIEAAIVVPLMLRRMLDADPAAMVSLRVILTGGARLEPTLATRTIESLGEVLYNLYGTSEVGFSILASPTDLRHFPSSLGRPIGGVRLKIAREDGTEAPVGETGVISISSGWAMEGNVGRSSGTGDLGHVDAQGRVYLSGRADDMIVSGGENVFLQDVERILEVHPDVLEAVVLGIPDPEFGQRLAAFVVPRPGTQLPAEALRTWLVGRAARFQIPSRILVLEEIPMTPVGKTDRKALLALV